MSNANNTTIITGHDAIAYAEKHDLPLCMYNSPIEGAREGLTVEEARQVAAEDPGLVYVVVEASASHWTVDNSDRDRTIWTRPGLDVMVETYEADDFEGYTISYVSDGLPAGPTDAYQRFSTLEDAQRAAERFEG